MPYGLHDYGHRLTARNAYYQPANGVHPNGYLFNGVREPRNLDGQSSLPHHGEPVLITPHDATGWLQPGQCFLASDVDFDQLSPASGTGQLASTAELIRGLRNASLDYGADTRVEIHSRIVKPLLDITLLFLGLPLVVARENRNVFLAMGLCMGVTALFSVFVWFSQYVRRRLALSAIRRLDAADGLRSRGRLADGIVLEVKGLSRFTILPHLSAAFALTRSWRHSNIRGPTDSSAVTGVFKQLITKPIGRRAPFGRGPRRTSRGGTFGRRGDTPMWRWLLIAILVLSGQCVLAQDHFGVAPSADSSPGPAIGHPGPDSLEPPNPYASAWPPPGGSLPEPAHLRRRLPAGSRNDAGGAHGAGDRACRAVAVGDGPQPSGRRGSHDRIDLVLS